MGSIPIKWIAGGDLYLAVSNLSKQKVAMGGGWARSLAVEWHPNEEDEVKIWRRFVWAPF
jgi:hypothetical protein